MTQIDHLARPTAPASDAVVLEAVTSFEQALLRLQAALSDNLASCEAVRRSVHEQTSMAELMAAIGIGQVRQGLTDAVIELEASRRHLRAVCFARVAGEGHSIAAIARLWGVSRQLAQRTIREADAPPHRWRSVRSAP